MPHCFFDTFDGEGFLPDENGLEFESLAAARLVVYLCALPDKRDFSERLGWQRLEENVGRNRLTVLTLTRR
jgi:hypothetical protein